MRTLVMKHSTLHGASYNRVEPLKTLFFIHRDVVPSLEFCLAQAMKVCVANNWNEPSSVAWSVVVREVELGRELVVGDSLGWVIFPSIAWVKNSAYVGDGRREVLVTVEANPDRSEEELVRCPYFRG